MTPAFIARREGNGSPMPDFMFTLLQQTRNPYGSNINAAKNATVPRPAMECRLPATEGSVLCAHRPLASNKGGANGVGRQSTVTRTAPFACFLAENASGNPVPVPLGEGRKSPAGSHRLVGRHVQPTVVRLPGSTPLSRAHPRYSPCVVVKSHPAPRPASVSRLGEMSPKSHARRCDREADRSGTSRRSVLDPWARLNFNAMPSLACRHQFPRCKRPPTDTSTASPGSKAAPAPCPSFIHLRSSQPSLMAVLVGVKPV